MNWQSILKVLGMFAVTGLAFGIGALISMNEMGAFDEGGGMGQALATGLVVLSVTAFTLLSGNLLAAIGGHFLGRTSKDRGAAVLNGALGGGLGHLVLVLVFGVTMAIGAGVMAPGDAADGEAAEGTGTATDVGDFAGMAWGLIPAAIVGAATAALFFEERAEYAGEVVTAGTTTPRGPPPAE